MASDEFIATGKPPRAIPAWFNLSYASYLVLPRSVLQSMPGERKVRPPVSERALQGLVGRPANRRRHRRSLGGLRARSSSAGAQRAAPGLSALRGLIDHAYFRRIVRPSRRTSSGGRRDEPRSVQIRKVVDSLRLEDHIVSVDLRCLVYPPGMRGGFEFDWPRGSAYLVFIGHSREPGFLHLLRHPSQRSCGGSGCPGSGVRG